MIAFVELVIQSDPLYYDHLSPKYSAMDTPITPFAFVLYLADNIIIVITIW